MENQGSSHATDSNFQDKRPAPIVSFRSILPTVHGPGSAVPPAEGHWGQHSRDRTCIEISYKARCLELGVIGQQRRPRSSCGPAVALRGAADGH